LALTRHSINKNFISSVKNTSWKFGGVTQAVEHLPSKCEALSSNPSTTKKNEKEKKRKKSKLWFK
jgi:hypothetical protein